MTLEKQLAEIKAKEILAILEEQKAFAMTGKADLLLVDELEKELGKAGYEMTVIRNEYTCETDILVTTNKWE